MCARICACTCSVCVCVCRRAHIRTHACARHACMCVWCGCVFVCVHSCLCLCRQDLHLCVSDGHLFFSCTAHVPLYVCMHGVPFALFICVVVAFLRRTPAFLTRRSCVPRLLPFAYVCLVFISVWGRALSKCIACTRIRSSNGAAQTSG